MFDEEKFETECRMNSEYNSGYDAGIRHEKKPDPQLLIRNSHNRYDERPRPA